MPPAQPQQSSDIVLNAPDSTNPATGGLCDSLRWAFCRSSSGVRGSNLRFGWAVATARGYHLTPRLGERDHVTGHATVTDVPLFSTAAERYIAKYREARL